MANLNNIISAYEDTKKIYDRIEPNERILETLKFLTDNHFGRWTFVKANFGENFQWAKSDTSEQHYIQIQRQGHFTLQDVENMKGVNYGQFEFGAEHFCLIAIKLRHRIKTVHVLPMTSLKEKTPSKDWDIVITPKEYPFLLHDTIIHVGRVQEIGLERFLLKDIKKYLLKPSGLPYELSKEHIIKAQTILHTLF